MAAKKQHADSTAPASRKVKQISMIEHVKTRSMWAGSKTPQIIDHYVLVNKADEKIFQLSELRYPPALLKIIDEIVVNAIDHHVLNPKLVKEIKISVTNDGEITVYNDGPGIHIEKTKNLQGVEMYTPQLIFGEFMAGSNFGDSKDRIVGGQNGIGSKLTVVFSKIFTIETLDSISGLVYKQSFCDGLTRIEPPEIKKATSKKSYTKITFLPNYAEFDLQINTFADTLNKLLETRAWQAAAYVNAKVYYNDERISLSSFANFCQMFTDNLVLPLDMYKTDNPDEHPWEVCIAISDGKERQISIVNGVFMPKGGNHIRHIQNHIIANLRDKIEKEIKKSGAKFNKNYVTNNVFVFMKGPVPSPEFMSQTKESVDDPIEKFANYEFKGNMWGKIWELLEPAILSTFLKKQLGDVKTRANRGKIDVPKYREANFCRDSKKCHKCGLIITEGDSAIGTADIGLLSKASEEFNYDWFGVFSIGGVPINGLKESIELKQRRTKDDSDIPNNEKSTKTKSKKPAESGDDLKMPPKRIPNKKILANERMSSLNKVLGLDYNKSYMQNEIGDREFKTLRYGFVVGLTDQDLDGFNIYGLIATYFMTYWPALLQRGFLRRINTPLIRAYPKNRRKNKVKEFYSERAAKEWMVSIGEADVKKDYRIEYYKGLGSHKEAYKEVTQMFKNINQKIRQYTLDEESFRTLHIYYGDDSKQRKIHLANPVVEMPSDDLLVPISQHFKIDTKSYQRDNNIRKLLSVPDGFVDSRRKVFFTARKNGREVIKVSGLAGKVISDANYHHGDVGLAQTIVRMAQGYPMARNLPLLLPLGNFGTRAKGYKDFAASRYIYTTINHHLADKLFRKEDDYILEYVLDDGNRYEPKYYVPILPYVLLEDTHIPGTGWKIDVYARNIKDVFKNTREMIEGKINKCGKLRPWARGFKGRIKTYKGRCYYVGNYTYDKDTNSVHITELPPNTNSNAYLKGSDEKKSAETKKCIKSLEWVEDFEDNTDMDGVNITIYLKEGAYEAITSEDSKYGNDVFDPIESYLNLKEPIYHHINLVNERYEVVEYKSYEDVFNDWFTFRKKLYEIRIEREKILVELEMMMLQNMQRFSQKHTEYGITNSMSEEKAKNILKENNYQIFNHTILDNPRYTSIQELKDLITREDNGASYEYILRMSYRDFTKEAYNKRQKRIEELQKRQEYILDDGGLFPGAKIWLLELDELELAITEGLKTQWFYGENIYTFED